MNDHFDPFEEAAKAPPPDEGPSFEDLPPKAWCLGTTCTEENGRAAPEIRTQEWKDRGSGEERIAQKFSIGLRCQGGDNLISDKHRNATVFYETFVHPGDREPEGMVLSGKLTGFLNAVFGPGIESNDKEERKRLRWQNTLAKLKEVATEQGWGLEQFGGDTALLFAGCAVEALKKESRPILFKTRARSYKSKKDGQQYTSIEVQQTEDDTPENRHNRGIRELATEERAKPPF